MTVTYLSVLVVGMFLATGHYADAAEIAALVSHTLQVRLWMINIVLSAVLQSPW